MTNKFVKLVHLVGFITRKSVSIFVNHRDLVQRECVKCIVSSDVETCRSSILAMNCILLSAFVGRYVDYFIYYLPKTCILQM
jgi:hypothetical protein